MLVRDTRCWDGMGGLLCHGADQPGFQARHKQPCCVYHPARKVSVVVHGDDLTALGARDDLAWYRSQLEEVFELKVKGLLGESPDCDEEVRVLNRVVSLLQLLMWRISQVFQK